LQAIQFESAKSAQEEKADLVILKQGGDSNQTAQMTSGVLDRSSTARSMQY